MIVDYQYFSFLLRAADVVQRQEYLLLPILYGKCCVCIIEHEQA